MTNSTPTTQTAPNAPELSILRANIDLKLLAPAQLLLDEGYDVLYANMNHVPARFMYVEKDGIRLTCQNSHIVPFGYSVHYPIKPSREYGSSLLVFQDDITNSDGTTFDPRDVLELVKLATTPTYANPFVPGVIHDNYLGRYFDDKLIRVTTDADNRIPDDMIDLDLDIIDNKKKYVALLGRDNI